MRKTKIICTLGPATENDEVLKELMINGMSVARLNMSHGVHADHKARLEKIKKFRDELQIPVATLLDTRGPEIRTGNFPNKTAELKTGQIFTFTTKKVDGDENICSITYADLYKDVEIGSHILVDDGLIEMKVIEIVKKDIRCEVLNDGPIAGHKGINVPGVRLSLPFLSEQDKLDIAFGVKEDVDFVAASFTRSAHDILQLRAELEKNNSTDIRIVAKIENAEGVNNIDEIIRVSDGIMVARGDLGVEIPLEEIPIIQKKLISKAYSAGKQVITATQLLDSMMKNPRPTRAEATDVANAIYDGTSAIMLSGETAAGNFPVDAVKTMAIIAERTEEDIDYTAIFRKRDIPERQDVTSAISHATCTTAHDLRAVAIITVSKTGQTARMISKYRPAYPIISGTTNPKVQRQMAMSWGVIPILVDEKDNTDELFEHVVSMAQKNKLVNNGDLVVITAGIPLGVSGTTNMLKVQLVGDVLLSGTVVNHNSVYGRLCVCKTEQEAFENFKDGDILVIPSTSNEILPIMRNASGIITETGGATSHAAVVALALDKPVIINAKNAVKLLKSGTTVKLDGDRGIVFSANTNIHK